jgi:hypothetical protein
MRARAVRCCWVLLARPGPPSTSRGASPAWACTTRRLLPHSSTTRSLPKAGVERTHRDLLRACEAREGGGAARGWAGGWRAGDSHRTAAGETDRYGQFSAKRTQTPVTAEKPHSQQACGRLQPHRQPSLHDRVAGHKLPRRGRGANLHSSRSLREASRRNTTAPRARSYTSTACCETRDRHALKVPSRSASRRPAPSRRGDERVSGQKWTLSTLAIPYPTLLRA